MSRYKKAQPVTLGKLIEDAAKAYFNSAAREVEFREWYMDRYGREYVPGEEERHGNES